MLYPALIVGGQNLRPQVTKQRFRHSCDQSAAICENAWGKVDCLLDAGQRIEAMKTMTILQKLMNRAFCRSLTHRKIGRDEWAPNR